MTRLQRGAVIRASLPLLLFFGAALFICSSVSSAQQCIGATVGLEVPAENSGIPTSTAHIVTVNFDFTGVITTTGGGGTSTSGGGSDPGNNSFIATRFNSLGAATSAPMSFFTGSVFAPYYPNPQTNAAYFFIADNSNATIHVPTGAPSRALIHVNIQTGNQQNTSVACTGMMVFSGDQVPVVYTNLSNPTISAYFMKALPIWGVGNQSSTIIGYNYTIGRDDYKLNKVALNHQSIDSRRAYGQPNIDGSTMADPNADPRNVTFASWVHKGGLFVGNLPFTTGDFSGTSRIQLTLPSTSFTDPRAESLSLFSFGGAGSVNPNF